MKRHANTREQRNDVFQSFLEEKTGAQAALKKAELEASEWAEVERRSKRQRFFAQQGGQ